jgi:hypothetical protein
LIKEGETLKNDQKDLTVLNEGFWKSRSKKNSVKKKCDIFLSKSINFE